MTKVAQLMRANPGWPYGFACGFAQGGEEARYGAPPDDSLWGCIDDFAHGYRSAYRSTFNRKWAGPSLCPVCGEVVTISGETQDGRIIGSCGDAFPYKYWLDCSECNKLGGAGNILQRGHLADGRPAFLCGHCDAEIQQQLECQADANRTGGKIG